MTGVNRVSSALRACAASLMLATFSSSAANALDGIILQDADMHIGPAAGFPIVGNVAAQTKVIVNGCTLGEGWCAVRHGGRHGWVDSANVDLTGITRSTNKLGSSVVVLDLTNQLPMPYPVGFGGSSSVPDLANIGDAPVVRFDLGRVNGANRPYYTSSSDLFANYGRYYDRRFGQFYGYPVLRDIFKPAGLVDPRTRRYRSYVGPNDEASRLRGLRFQGIGLDRLHRLHID